MINVFAILAGSVAGGLVGFFAGWLFVDFGWIPNNMIYKAVLGAVIGGIFGGIAGSISGDLNRAGDSGANRFLLALIFGALCGSLAATRLGLMGRLLESINVPHPFQS